MTNHSDGDSASKPVILVTGATGFLGSHIVQQLLTSGYAVRGTCRSYKVSLIHVKPDFHVVIMDDLTEGDYTKALVDITGIVHVASPVPVPGEKGDFIKLAVEGTLNLLHQASAAGITKVVLVGSFTSVLPNLFNDILDPMNIISPENWSPLSENDLLKCKPETLPMLTYMTSKVLAEKAAWNFVKENPHMDLISLYGPLAPLHIVKDPVSMLSTNGWIYALLCGPSGFYPKPPHPFSIDARDVGLAAVRALESHPLPGLLNRRIILSGGVVTLQQAVMHLRIVRPGLKSRLLDYGDPYCDTNEMTEAAKIDQTLAKTILGLSSYIPWQKSVEDAADSLIEKEENWL